jgi:hypothetical protein
MDRAARYADCDDAHDLSCSPCPSTGGGGAKRDCSGGGGGSGREPTATGGGGGMSGTVSSVPLTPPIARDRRCAAPPLADDAGPEARGVGRRGVVANGSKLSCALESC